MRVGKRLGIFVASAGLLILVCARGERATQAHEGASRGRRGRMARPRPRLHVRRTLLLGASMPWG